MRPMLIDGPRSSVPLPVEIPELTPDEEARVARVRRILQRSVGQWTFPQVYWDFMQKPGVAVHAPRQTGKTEALLHLLDACRDPAIVICPDRQMAHSLRARYWSEFRAENSRHEFANGNAVEYVEDFVCGNTKPVFCDEWFMLSLSVRKFLAKSGRVEAAIGTMPEWERPGENTIQCVPLC